MSKSFKVEVQARSSRRWSSNALRFATERDAKAYGLDLHARWSAVRAWRVVEADEAPTHRWDAERNRCVEVPALRLIDGGRAEAAEPTRWKHRWGIN